MENASIIVGLDGNIVAIGPTADLEKQYAAGVFERVIDATGTILPLYLFHRSSCIRENILILRNVRVARLCGCAHPSCLGGRPRARILHEALGSNIHGSP